MNNLVEKFEKKQIVKLTSKKNIPTFRSGDTLRVTIKIVEGERSRFQVYEGVERKSTQRRKKKGTGAPCSAGKTAATDIWLSIISQPGVLTTAAAVHELKNLETGKMLLKRLREKHGIETFGFTDLSFALGMAGKKRLLTLDSLNGRKIRTFAAAVNPVVASWGASPVVMSFGDVPSALESGVLDGVITSIGGWRAITEQTNYYTIAGIGTVAFDNYWVGASQIWWKRLNGDTQARLRALMLETMARQDKISWCNDQFAIGEFKANTAADAGIYRASAEEARPLQDAIGTNVAQYLKEKLPDEADAWVDTYLKEGKAASKRLAAGTDPLESLDCSPYREMLKRK